MKENTKHLCELCGEPMPAGEDIFVYHGYSGPCPKPPHSKPSQEGSWEESVAIKGGFQMMPGYMSETLIPFIAFLLSEKDKAIERAREEGLQLRREYNDPELIEPKDLHKLGK